MEITKSKIMRIEINIANFINFFIIEKIKPTKKNKRINFTNGGNVMIKLYNSIN